MRIIYQHDERDCGAACLAMIAENYGYNHSLSFFREMSNTTQEGTSAFDLVKAADGIGLSAEAMTGNVNELLISVRNGEIKTPFIAHVITEENQNHFLIVTDLSDQNVKVCDPEKGKGSMTSVLFDKIWTGNIITFTPNANFKEKKKTSRGVLSFFSLLNGQIKSFIAVIMISFLVAAIGITGAFVFQLVIDHSSELSISESSSHDEHIHDIAYETDNEAVNDVLEGISNIFNNLSVDSITVVFAFLIALYVVSAVVQYVRGRMIITMSKHIDEGLILPYFNRIIDLPILTIKKRRTGDYLSRYSDSSAIRDAISTATITMIIDTAMAVGCGLILYFQSPKLCLTAGVMIFLYAAIVLRNRKCIKDANRTFMEKNAAVQSYIKENIDGIDTIKGVNACEQIKDGMKTRFTSYMDAAVKKSRLVMTQEVLVTGIETIGIALILWQGFLMVFNGDLTLGSLITFYALLGYFITPVKNLIELQPVIQAGVVAAERINDILEIKGEDTNGIEIEDSKDVDEWKASGISFCHGNHDSLLRNINFTIHKGERTALVGKSGSGKTTLSKMFIRTFTPESGHVYADGIDVNKLSINSLRKMVSYVSNETTVFTGSIQENLRIGNAGCTNEDLEKVCEIVQLSELINDLPGKGRFIVEADGTNLSSGQKQRIVIARALLKKPKLLILDEATSNIDSESEKQIIGNIYKNYPSIAILMISHRFSSIKECEKLIVLDDGEIVGEGSHATLMMECDEYRAMFEAECNEKDTKYRLDKIVS